MQLFKVKYLWLFEPGCVFEGVSEKPCTQILSYFLSADLENPPRSQVVVQGQVYTFAACNHCFVCHEITFLCGFHPSLSPNPHLCLQHLTGNSLGLVSAFMALRSGLALCLWDFYPQNYERRRFLLKILPLWSCQHVRKERGARIPYQLINSDELVAKKSLQTTELSIPCGCSCCTESRRLLNYVNGLFSQI